MIEGSLRTTEETSLCSNSWLSSLQLGKLTLYVASKLAVQVKWYPEACTLNTAEIDLETARSM